MRNTSSCLIFGLLLGMLQISCNDENEVSYQLKTKTISLLTGKSLQLVVAPSTSGWSFSSKNNNIASVSESGLVTTHYAGTTMLYARHEVGQFVDSVKITVNPLNTLFNDPYLNFFTSELTVSKNETGRFIMRMESTKYEGVFVLDYDRPLDSEFNYSVDYHFNTSGLYDYSIISLDPIHSFEVDNHVSDRYIFLGEKNYTYSGDAFIDKHYISPDSSKLICVTNFTDELLVQFRPYTTQAMEAIQNDTIGMVFDIWNSI